MIRLSPEGAILLSGVAFFGALSVIALVPDQATDPGAETNLGTSAQVAGVAAAQRPPVTPTGVTQTRQQPGTARTVAMLQPAEALPTIPYRGIVSSLRAPSTGTWGQIHVQLDIGRQQMPDVSLAPAWFLDFQGCKLAVGDQIQGEGFRFSNRAGTSSTLYAKNIIVNTKRCRLRSIHGLALWSGQMR
jgi:hypothetical protein